MHAHVENFTRESSYCFSAS